LDTLPSEAVFAIILGIDFMRAPSGRLEIVDDC
jgi:hypothetical protein